MMVDGVTLHVPPDVDEAQLTRMIRAIRAVSGSRILPKSWSAPLRVAHETI